MGSTCSIDSKKRPKAKNAEESSVIPSQVISDQDVEESGEWNDVVAEEIGRMLVASSDDDPQTFSENIDKCSDKLSEIAENLFLQQKNSTDRNRSENRPFEVSSHPAPIELSEEQVRRRLNKRRGGKASIDVSLLSRLPQAARSKNLILSSETFLGVRNKVLEPVSEIEDETETETKETTSFQRVFISGGDEEMLSQEIIDIAMSLIHALSTREYYMRLSHQSFLSLTSKYLSIARGKQVHESLLPDYINPLAEPVKWHADQKSLKVVTRKGVVSVYDPETDEELPFPCMKRERFVTNRNLLYALVADGPLKSFCYRRLSYLKSKFQLHRLLNEVSESEAMKNPERACRRDFYNVRKVDTHIHAAACMGQKHLLGFMQEKARKEPDVVVLKRNGLNMTLTQVFDHLKLDPLFLNVDSLDVHANRQTFQRFDRFNNLYSPMGASELREIFLKTDNDTGGEYFAQIIKQVEANLVTQKYHHLELRLSIYGKSYDEWEKLAHWFVTHKLESVHIRWLIQIPRLYDVYKAKGVVDSFQVILDNVFRPIFEATIRPSKNKDIHLFLRHVIGFDSVDDESKPEPGFMKSTSPTPDEWKRDTNPSYTYYIYYLYVNIMRLNHLRKEKGLNTIALRPHCGEAGHHDHLLTAFLLADNISHGLVLKKVPVLQYLYYLSQIGIAMSPLSNNHLFLEYNKNPFPDYFAKGLNVCLSTDDPLQFHFTMEPLMEEYAVAAQVWKLSVCDMCEIARNSVLMSGFSHDEKKKWLGENYRLDGAAASNIGRTNVPEIRIAFRHETLSDELTLLCKEIAAARSSKSSIAR